MRLKYHIVRAKYMLAKGQQPVKVLQYLKGKHSLEYVYEELDQYVMLMLSLYEKAGFKLSRDRFLFQYCKLMEYNQTETQELKAFYQSICSAASAAKNRLLNENSDQALNLIELCQCCYVMHDDVTTALLLHLLERESTVDAKLVEMNQVAAKQLETMRKELQEIGQSELDSKNIPTLCRLLDDKTVPFFVFYNRYTGDLESRVITKLLKFFTTNVYMTEIEEITKVADYIDSMSGTNMCIFFGTGALTDEILLDNQCRRFGERLSQVQYDYFENYMAFARFGNYMEYLNKIYGKDVSEDLYCTTRYRFSIIVPARNNAQTLKSTLQTCLNQEFNDFEVVLSDNSDRENHQIYQLYEEMKCEKLHYYRTPACLPLARSFEYAFLMSRGEFVFSLGADDGVMPWALTVLNRVLENYPEEDVIKWSYGGFSWPSAGNFSDKNQFSVKKCYKSEIQNIGYISSETMLSVSLKEPEKMYSLPTFYMQSGCLRKYLEKMLEKTGRLWGGLNQDIYTGVVNLGTIPGYLHINEVLTIVGRSDASIGAVNRIGSMTASAENIEIIGNQGFLDNEDMMGIYVRSYMERLLPDIGGEVVYFYEAILYAIAIGVLDEKLIEKMDWKKVFTCIVQQIDIRDELYETKINQVRYAVEKAEPELLPWFDKECYLKNLVPCMVDNNANKIQYQTGYNDMGGFILNAKEEGLLTIADAVDFCVNYFGTFKKDGKEI